jgi:hypothetical protein
MVYHSNGFSHVYRLSNRHAPEPDRTEFISHDITWDREKSLLPGIEPVPFRLGLIPEIFIQYVPESPQPAQNVEFFNCPILDLLTTNKESTMKNSIVKLLAVSILAAATFPAQAASTLQIWSCKLEDGKTFEDARAVSSAWLKAANGMETGKQLEVYLDYPLAADTESGEFGFVLEAPNSTVWGAFDDSYLGSPAQEADEAFSEVATCNGSSLWTSEKIE